MTIFFLSLPVMIKPFQGSPQYKAAVIYSHSGSLNKPYDVAILKCAEAMVGLQFSRMPEACSPKLGLLGVIVNFQTITKSDASQLGISHMYYHHLLSK